MSNRNALYHWLTDWLQQEPAAALLRLSDFEQVRQTLLPGDVLLVDGQSRVDRTFKTIAGSRWSRACLYLGRLHDIKDPGLRAQLAEYLTCTPDTQLIIETRLDRGLVLQPLSTLEPEHVRICRPGALSPQDAAEVVRYACSRLGVGQDTSWWTLLALLLPWGLLPRRWRPPAFARVANGLFRLLSGTPIGEAFSFIQYPILPLVKRVEGDRTRLFRRHPRVFLAVDFDHSPYFDIIKYPFVDLLTDERVRLQPWQGNALALNRAHRDGDKPPLALVRDKDDGGNQPGKASPGG
ncbi:MAG: hypothetical protein P1U64_09420 [Alcanivoracaceae bacterium]|jgi:hypothetical protein|nr:hypothetical protein [Alcanivoracaceae bacterium]